MSKLDSQGGNPCTDRSILKNCCSDAIRQLIVSMFLDKGNDYNCNFALGVAAIRYPQLLSKWTEFFNKDDEDEQGKLVRSIEELLMLGIQGRIIDGNEMADPCATWSFIFNFVCDYPNTKLCHVFLQKMQGLSDSELTSLFKKVNPEKFPDLIKKALSMGIKINMRGLISGLDAEQQFIALSSLVQDFGALYTAFAFRRKVDEDAINAILSLIEKKVSYLYLTR